MSPVSVSFFLYIPSRPRVPIPPFFSFAFVFVMPSKWSSKGKQRAYPGTMQRRQRRDDSTGTGEGDGIVVSLEFVGTTVYNAHV